MEAYWDVIKRLIIESDIVIEVLDARSVELSRNKEAEKLIKDLGRPFIFVVNKSDLVSKNYLKKQLKKLRRDGVVIFVSTKIKGSTKNLLFAIKKNFDIYGKREPTFKDKFSPKTKSREARGDIVVGILGYPNTGKSSIINAIAHRKKAKISKKAGTTHGIHWIKATNEIKFIDSPGVIPLKWEDEAKHGLIGAKDADKLDNPEKVAHILIKLFLDNNKKSLEQFYNLEFSSNEPEKIIEQIAEKNRYLLKGEKLDVNRAEVTLIREWQQGKLRI
jgi:ribosome biogenesis GTPase A